MPVESMARSPFHFSHSIAACDKYGYLPADDRERMETGVVYKRYTPMESTQPPVRIRRTKYPYLSISKMNKGNGGKLDCSQPIKMRNLEGVVDFPLQLYIDLDFRRFKLLRARPGSMTGI